LDPGPADLERLAIAADLDERRRENPPAERLGHRGGAGQAELERLPSELDAEARLAPADRRQRFLDHTDRLADEVARCAHGAQPGIDRGAGRRLARFQRGGAYTLLRREFGVE